MTAYYVWSGAAGAGTGADWANAFTTITTAIASMSAGDSLLVAHDHAESVSGSNIVLTFPGVLGTPCYVYCVRRDGNVPPTGADLTTGATVTTTGTGSIHIDGVVFVWGVEFSAGSGSVNASIIMGNAAANVAQHYFFCRFVLGTTAASGQYIQFGNTSFWIRHILWYQCHAKFGGAGSQRIAIGQAVFEWYGGSILSGSATPNAVFLNSRSAPASGSITVVGVDFSNLSSSANFFDGGGFDSGALRRCKLPSSWAGSLVTGTIPAPQNYWDMVDCDDGGSVVIRRWREQYAGSVRDVTAVARTNGANDNGTPYSLQMVSSANTDYPGLYLVSPEIYARVPAAGDTTFTVEVVTDGVTLKDDEIWLELAYPGTSGTRLATIINQAKLNPLASATDQASSSADWDDDALSSPVKQKLEITADIAEPGQVTLRVILARPSTTVYVDPLVTVAEAA